MKLNDLEKAVLQLFFESEEQWTLDTSLDEIEIVDRDPSKVGFMTFIVPNKYKVSPGSENFTDGEIGAILNETLHTGYLIYIRDGYLKTLEGYSYGELWPTQVDHFKVYVENM